MSNVRLYFDEDTEEEAVVHGLRVRGADILTTLEAERCGTSDEKQLEFATEQGRTIYTFNVGHFAALHADCLARGIEHRGIVVIPDQRLSIGEKVRRLARLVASVSAAEMFNRMEFL